MAVTQDSSADCLGEKAEHSDFPDVGLASTENGHTGVGRFILFKSESEPHDLGGIPCLPDHWLCD